LRLSDSVKIYAALRYYLSSCLNLEIATLPHSQRVRHCCRLGLLAMLLLLVGPLLGQGLSLRNEHACSDEHEKTLSVSHEQGWAKCGYCTLLLSSPAVPSSLPLVQTGSVVPIQSVLLVPLIANSSTVFIGALTRAPPSFLVL